MNDFKCTANEWNDQMSLVSKHYTILTHSSYRENAEWMFSKVNDHTEIMDRNQFTDLHACHNKNHAINQS